MNLKKLMVRILFGLAPLPALAQQSLSGSLANYSPAVIARVQEVRSKIALSSERETLFALHFQKTDSLLADEVQKGARAGRMQAIRETSEIEFRKLFSPQELDAYYFEHTRNAAEQEATAMSSFLQKKYGINEPMRKSLYQYFYSRRVQLDSLFRAGMGSGDGANHLLAAYDSAEARLMYAVKGQAFLNEKIAFLRNIYPLTREQYEKLRTTYTNAVQDYNTVKSYADYFNESMRRTITDTIYYAAIYKDNIDRMSRYNATLEINALSADKHISPEAFSSILSLVRNKQKALATLAYSMPVYSRFSDSLNKQAARHYDSLISIALMRDGIFPNKSLVAIALKNRSRLGLNTAQADSLFAKGIYLESLRRDFALQSPEGKFEPTPYEAEWLPRILNEDQQLQLLALKNKPTAMEWATRDFKEMQKRGLAAGPGMDSLSVAVQLTEYYINRLVIKDRYVNDPVKQNTYAKDIDNHSMPMPLRRLKSAQRKDGKAATAQGTPANFQW